MGKPYRSTDTPLDAFDKKYTDIMKKKFITLPSYLKDTVEKMTENLMQDEIISKHELLDAIEDYKKKYNVICTEIYSYHWTGFYDYAFNCRPWQA